jgi:hypothetical protein
MRHASENEAAAQSILAMLGDLPDPRQGLRKGHDGGWFNAQGYPVNPWGRPDWCSRCATIEVEMVRLDPNWRPSRVDRKRILNDREGSRVVVPGLCAECAELARGTRTRVQQEQTAKVIDLRGQR